MASDEAHRHALHEAARHAFGEGAATTLMEMLPPVGWADVATKRDLDHLESSLRAEIAGLRLEVRGEIAELRGAVTGLHGEMSGLHGEMTGLHGEMTGLRSQMIGLRGEMQGEIARASQRVILWIVPVVIAAFGASTAINLA